MVNSSDSPEKKPARRRIVRRKAPAVPIPPVGQPAPDVGNQAGGHGLLKNYGTPFSILLGAAIIALGIYFSKNPFTPTPVSTNPAGGVQRVDVSADDDPVLGQADAPV